MLSFVIDYGLFLVCLHILHINYALAATLSFTIAVLFNWYLNAHWVFNSTKIARKSVEVLLFFVLAVVGLGMNQLFLWIGIDILSMRAEIAKLIVTIVVAIWGFVMRKMVLYR